jgi:hypothetical protein
MKNTKQFLVYAWHGSFSRANNLAAGSGALLITFVCAMSGREIDLPNGFLGLFLGWLFSATAIWIIIFTWSLATASLHFKYESYGGFRAYLRQRTKLHMLPIILIASGTLFSAVAAAISSVGIWLVLSHTSPFRNSDEKTNLLFDLQKLTFMQQGFVNAELQAQNTSDEVFKRIVDYYDPQSKVMKYPFQKTQMYFRDAISNIENNVKNGLGITVHLQQVLTQDLPNFNQYTLVEGDAACVTDECRVTFRREKIRHNAIFQQVKQLENIYVARLNELKRRISEYSD